MRAEAPTTVLEARPVRDAIVRKRILVRGIVQGVGFRPFVYREAVSRALSGWVENARDGVMVEAEGPAAHVDGLADAIGAVPPDAARVTAIETSIVPALSGSGFVIRDSAVEGDRVADVPVDRATCADCLAELLDPANRRHRYPFINCTQCGPRASIIENMPYDRHRTTMRGFVMCPSCQAEYDDPFDRRFHAEPNACPVCGPRLFLWDPRGSEIAANDTALEGAADAVRDGLIVAVKGIGGFHLICDARNRMAVDALRIRKRRRRKPFAVMFPDLESVRHACRVSGTEEALLTGSERPIVLLRRSDDGLVTAVAPRNPRLGAMLPYAPLHHLLMHDLGFPVVATSGNVSDEPIVVDEGDALDRLAGIADIFLVHDRPIIRPIDDPVVQLVAGHEQILRRGRGYAPSRFPIDGAAAGVVAVGGQLKTTVAASESGSVVLGPHIGDLDTVSARRAHESALDDLIRLFDVVPRQVACDLHPDYESSRAALSLGRPITRVQHHLAHVASCMGENRIEPPVLGVAWDGTGFGTDGTVWGGEFIAIEKDGWRRVGHIRPFGLPGGEAAVREPRRAALGLLHEAYGAAAWSMKDVAPLETLSATEQRVIEMMLTRNINTPRTSSVGRLLDGFAALCGLCPVNEYEGEAACALEWTADRQPAGRAFSFPVVTDARGMLIVDWQPALDAVLAALRAGEAPGAIAAAVHDGLCEAVLAVADRVGFIQVALSGGCFQNVRLTEGAVASLAKAGFEPFWQRRVPPNDGGISFGQAVWASGRGETDEH